MKFQARSCHQETLSTKELFVNSESNPKCDRYQLGVGWCCSGVVIARLKIHAVSWFSYFDGEPDSSVETGSRGRCACQRLITAYHAR